MFDCCFTLLSPFFHMQNWSNPPSLVLLLNHWLLPRPVGLRVSQSPGNWGLWIFDWPWEILWPAIWNHLGLHVQDQKIFEAPNDTPRPTSSVPESLHTGHFNRFGWPGSPYPTTVTCYILMLVPLVLGMFTTRVWFPLRIAYHDTFQLRLKSPKPCGRFAGYLRENKNCCGTGRLGFGRASLLHTLAENPYIPQGYLHRRIGLSFVLALLCCICSR